VSDDELVDAMCAAAWGAEWPFLMEHLRIRAKADMLRALAVADPAIRERCATTLNAEVTLLTKHRDAFERMGNSDSVRAITRDIENTKRFIRAIRTGGTTT